MNKGIWVAFKENKIVGYVITKEEADVRLAEGQVDSFMWCDLQTNNQGAVIPYLDINWSA